MLISVGAPGQGLRDRVAGGASLAGGGAHLRARSWAVGEGRGVPRWGSGAVM